MVGPGRDELLVLLRDFSGGNGNAWLSGLGGGGGAGNPADVCSNPDSADFVMLAWLRFNRELFDAGTSTATLPSFGVGASD